MPISRFVPTAEAAFIAGLTDRQMNRVVDERLVPEMLFEQHGNSRSFARLGAAFARFYFETEDLLIAGARRQVLEELTARVGQAHVTEASLLNLSGLDSMNWKVEIKSVEVDVQPYLREALSRASEIDRAAELVSTDPEIMGGTPVFTGTRVPIEAVLDSLAAGILLDRLRSSYPFLTEAHVQAARVYTAVHPRRGRPRRIGAVNPGLRSRLTRIVERPADA